MHSHRCRNDMMIAIIKSHAHLITNSFLVSAWKVTIFINQHETITGLLALVASFAYMNIVTLFVTSMVANSKITLEPKHLRYVYQNLYVLSWICKNKQGNKHVVQITRIDASYTCTPLCKSNGTFFRCENFQVLTFSSFPKIWAFQIEVLVST